VLAAGEWCRAHDVPFVLHDTAGLRAGAVNAGPACPPLP
jgi:hypothetical protein